MKKIKSDNNSVDISAMRHSCEHILTQTMLKLWPGKIVMAMGPSTADGFYFDFETKGDIKISEDDFPRIEKEMKTIIEKNLPITRKTISAKEARKIFAENPYKIEWVDEIEKRGEKVSTYKTGDEFTDLCAGPHLSSTGEIGAFKLLSIAGAYWHGNEKNKMLTRIYGTCFPSQIELDKYLAMIEEAKKRDHRKLNQTLKLYFLSDEIGQGLATLLPNGAVIAEELENWAKVTEKKWGYVRVFTPHIASEKLFMKTGHVPYYVPHMYPPMRMEEKGEGETEVYYLKPMNCAGHSMVYKAQPRSYRDLPLRIAEYGAVYRYEASGELHGIMRVRGPIHQNDAHIFCTEDQAEEEFQSVMELHKYYYETLGLSEKDYYLSFAIRGKDPKEKYLGDPKIWEKAEKITLEYIKKSKIPYEIEEGGAAFYGPKIDFNIRTVTGKVFSASTNQLDFMIPRAFDLKYTDKDGKEKTPVCIHRAPLGAHVRFVAFLTEHFAGAFPLWLAPIQARILPISDKQNDFAKKIYREMLEQDVRAELDDSNQTLSYRIRKAQIEKIPVVLIIGQNEVEGKTISARLRSGEEKKEVSPDQFINQMKNLIKEKSLSLSFGKGIN